VRESLPEVFRPSRACRSAQELARQGTNMSGRGMTLRLLHPPLLVIGLDVNAEQFPAACQGEDRKSFCNSPLGGRQLGPAGRFQSFVREDEARGGFGL